MGIKAWAGAALAAAAALGAAAPAVAQTYGYGGPGYAAAYGYRYGWSDPAAALHAREDRVAGWIRSARDGGRIEPWRADDAWARLRRVRDDEHRTRWMQGGFLRPDQAARLNDRVSLIADQLRLEADSGPPRARWR